MQRAVPPDGSASTSASVEGDSSRSRRRGAPRSAWSSRVAEGVDVDAVPDPRRCRAPSSEPAQDDRARAAVRAATARALVRRISCLLARGCTSLTRAGPGRIPPRGPGKGLDVGAGHDGVADRRTAVDDRPSVPGAAHETGVAQHAAGGPAPHPGCARSCGRAAWWTRASRAAAAGRPGTGRAAGRGPPASWSRTPRARRCRARGRRSSGARAARCTSRGWGARRPRARTSGRGRRGARPRRPGRRISTPPSRHRSVGCRSSRASAQPPRASRSARCRTSRSAIASSWGQSGPTSVCHIRSSASASHEVTSGRSSTTRTSRSTEPVRASARSICSRAITAGVDLTASRSSVAACGPCRRAAGR